MLNPSPFLSVQARDFLIVHIDLKSLLLVTPPSKKKVLLLCFQASFALRLINQWLPVTSAVIPTAASNAGIFISASMYVWTHGILQAQLNEATNQVLKNGTTASSLGEGANVAVPTTIKKSTVYSHSPSTNITMVSVNDTKNTSSWTDTSTAVAIRISSPEKQ